MLRPFTRSNFLTLSVTRAADTLSAWAAIKVSSGPIGVPLDCGCRHSKRWLRYQKAGIQIDIESIQVLSGWLISFQSNGFIHVIQQHQQLFGRMVDG